MTDDSKHIETATGEVEIVGELDDDGAAALVAQLTDAERERLRDALADVANEAAPINQAAMAEAAQLAADIEDNAQAAEDEGLTLRYHDSDGLWHKATPPVLELGPQLERQRRLEDTPPGVYERNDELDDDGRPW